MKARASAPRAASSAPDRAVLASERGWNAEPSTVAAAGHDLAAVSVHAPTTGTAAIQRVRSSDGAPIQRAPSAIRRAFATRTGAQDTARLQARRETTAARRKAFRDENRRKIQEMRAQRPRRRRRQFPAA